MYAWVLAAGTQYIPQIGSHSESSFETIEGDSIPVVC